MPTSIESILDQQVSARIKDIGRLATLPQVTWEIMRLMGDEHTSPADLQKVVEQDPVLSAKVISLSNSSYYGLRTPVTTIDRSIMVIGFKELEFLAMGLGLAETFDLRKVPYGFDGEGLWLHSLSVSWAAREIAPIAKVDPGEAMLAGLLHNLGQIILVTHFTVQLQRLMDYVNSGLSFGQAEADLGLWHEAIGNILAKNWALPKMLQDVMLYHHRPEIAPDNKKMLAVVGLAVEMISHTSFAIEYEEYEADLDYLEKTTGVDKNTREAILGKAAEILPQMAPTWLQMLPSGKKRSTSVQ